MVRGFTPIRPYHGIILLRFVKISVNFYGDFRAPDKRHVKNRETDQRNRKKDPPGFVGTWYLVRTRTRCGRLSVSDNFSGTSGKREAEKAGAFFK